MFLFLILLACTTTGMNESETKIQSAIWELVTTEVYYIHALQTVTDVRYFLYTYILPTYSS